MKAFCTKCEINWGSLASQDHAERDETYYYCPKCKSDHALEEVHDGPQYLMNLLNGKVIDIKTREELLPAIPVSTYVPTIPFDREAWRIKKEVEEDNILLAINAYQEAFETGGQAAGEAAYYKKIKDLNS